MNDPIDPLLPSPAPTPAPAKRKQGLAAVAPMKARAIQRAGGAALARNREHMARIGAKGGAAGKAKTKPRRRKGGAR